MPVYRKLKTKKKHSEKDKSNSRISDSFKNNICDFTEPNYCQGKESGGHQNTIFSIGKTKCAKRINLKHPELKFYREYNKLGMKILNNFIPKYYEICNKDKSHFIVLENLKSGFTKPLTIDIKFGFTTSSKKIMDIHNYSVVNQKIKSFKHWFLDKVLSSTSKLGFRIEGATLNKSLTKKKLMFQNVFKTFNSYFSSDKNNYALDIFINKLNELIERFTNNSEFQKILFMGSSILFTYDSMNPANTSFKFIDFDNSIILETQTDINKNKQHSMNTIQAFKNIQTTLQKFRQIKNN